MRVAAAAGLHQPAHDVGQQVALRPVARHRPQDDGRGAHVGVHIPVVRRRFLPVCAGGAHHRVAHQIGQQGVDARLLFGIQQPQGHGQGRLAVAAELVAHLEERDGATQLALHLGAVDQADVFA